MQTREEVFETLKQVIANCVSTEELTEKTALEDDLGLDSLDVLSLSFDCEKEFQINISDEEIEKLTTVGDLLSTICSKLDKSSI